MEKYYAKLAVLYQGQGDIKPFKQLAERLDVPLYEVINNESPECFFLTWRDGCLKLLDKELLKKGGLVVDIEPRNGEQRSWPAPKQGPLAQALGRKIKTVVDATAGWGQDGLHIFRMGYEVLCIERSPVMVELLQDGLNRLALEQRGISSHRDTQDLTAADNLLHAPTYSDVQHMFDAVDHPSDQRDVAVQVPRCMANHGVEFRARAGVG